MAEQLRQALRPVPQGGHERPPSATDAVPLVEFGRAVPRATLRAHTQRVDRQQLHADGGRAQAKAPARQEVQIGVGNSPQILRLSG